MSRSGFTLVESIVAIVIIGVLLAVGMPRMKDWLLREDVRAARRQVTTHLARGRATAVYRGCTAVLHLDGGTDRVWITSCAIQGPGVDTVGTIDDFWSHFGVTFTSDGDSVLFTPQGVALATNSISMVFTKAGYTRDLLITPVGRPVW
ncbi:MAG: prepilin-type N-terminal cleavage/methylation domain-containing protein [Gemmatimonadota bacterium]|nr:MAG: prepilin-type N-terminal cleavage/methylation domain-containing protein [Gemmatimonadota bacterium]